LALVTLAVYGRTVGFDFINFDDPDYFTRNPMIRAGLTFKGITWAFTHYYAGNWHPLTWISLMLDCQIFGFHPAGPHSVNVMLHTGNTVLLFLLLQSLTRAQWRSAMAAALFSLHPLHVESVAWIAERKDVLSTFFGLLSLLAYARYVGGFKAQSSNLKVCFWVAVGLFALGLMAKPMLVTWPFVMLLLDFWPLQRVENTGWRTFFTPQFGRLALEKWPWFILAAAASVITFYVQKISGAVLSTEHLPLSQRMENAVNSYFGYILNICWPVDLAVFYPMKHEHSLLLLLAEAVFLIGSSLLVLNAAKRRPYFLVGWLWFLGTLVPVIGLVQVGTQAMADRYSYIPSIGIFIVLVWGGFDWFFRSETSRVLAAGAAAVILALCAVLTVKQLQYWRDSLVLFHRALAVTRDNALANNNLAEALEAIGRGSDALPYYAKAVDIDPGNALYENNYGAALAARGRPADALAHYAKAVSVAPGMAAYQNNYGTALARSGDRNGAVEHYLAALRADPEYAEAYVNLGAVFEAEHRLNEAITNLEAAVRIEPDSGDARNNLAGVLLSAGNLDEALAQYAEALRLNPTNATTHLNTGLALVKAGQTSAAMSQFGEAVQLNPSYAEARYQLGRQLLLQGQFESARQELVEAARLKPEDGSNQFSLGVLLALSTAEAETGRFNEAVSNASEAIATAQQLGRTNLIPKIQRALEFYKSGRPYREN
jgi:tetratricopeptide (TPR) repeat protein